jgi:hypothetical protein
MSARPMRGSRAPRGLRHLDAEHGVRGHGGDRFAQRSAGDVGGTVDAHLQPREVDEFLLAIGM